MWKNSYKKTREERINLLKENGNINEENFKYLLETNVISNEIADKLIENQISIYGIPYGIATNFLIDDEEFVIPFAVEEPSVIAAACNAAKIIKENGGFKTYVKERLMIGHIAFYDVVNFELAKTKIESNKDKLIKIANDSQVNMVNIGGGARDLSVEIKNEFLIVYLHVDTRDAMGANTINTMLEVISPIIEEMIGAKKLMGIISNYSTRALVKAKCKLKLDEELSKKIELAIKFANSDKYRAVTNNKGIFNGIDAISLATGNDWRAIEAAIHAYAVKDGEYKSLSNWTYIDGYLEGELEIPMPIASYGGSIGISEISKISLNILKNPNSEKLARIATAVGLAQNFAALRALVSEGIQKGHMKLHIKTLGLYLGASNDEIELIIEKTKDLKHISMEEVKKVLEYIRKS